MIKGTRKNVPIKMMAGPAIASPISCRFRLARRPRLRLGVPTAALAGSVTASPFAIEVMVSPLEPIIWWAGATGAAQ
jgi:hypothetical protein